MEATSSPQGDAPGQQPNPSWHEPSASQHQIIEELTLPLTLRAIRYRTFPFGWAFRPIKPGRVLNPQDFQTNVDGMSAGMRVKGTELFLVVEADRTRLGQPATLRLSDSGTIRTAATTFIYIPPTNIADVVRERTATYALNGTIQVTAQPIPVFR